MLFSAVDLTDDMHGLADVVVQSEEEDRGVHHARRLVIQRAEELYKVARIRSDRAEPTRELESRAEVFIIGRSSTAACPPQHPRDSASGVRLQGEYRGDIEVGRSVRGSAA